MKGLVILMIIILLFSCNNRQHNSESTLKKWKEIRSEKGNFQIEFPNYEIEEGQTKLRVNDQDLLIYYYSLNSQNLDDANLGYRVDYSFWPHIETVEQIDSLFETQKDYIISVSNAQIEYEAIIDSLKFPGRELYLSINNSKVKVRYLMYFVNGTFYKLMVVTAGDELFNKSISRFANSFRITDIK